MADVTVRIPADHAEVFVNEAAFTLECAADQLGELLKFRRQGKGDVNPDQLEDARAKATAAERLFERASGGELEFEGDEQLGLTLDGCLLKAGSKVAGECEKVGTAPARTAVAELGVWLDLREVVA